MSGLALAVREVVGPDEDAASLAAALEAVVYVWALDMVSDLAERANARLPTGRLEVRLVGRQPELVYIEEAQAGSDGPSTKEPETARISLRLPPSLKTQVEQAAARSSMSVNTWIVTALAETSRGHRAPGGRRITGYGRG